MSLLGLVGVDASIFSARACAAFLASISTEVNSRSPFALGRPPYDCRVSLIIEDLPVPQAPHTLDGPTIRARYAGLGLSVYRTAVPQVVQHLSPRLVGCLPEKAESCQRARVRWRFMRPYQHGGSDIPYCLDDETDPLRLITGSEDE